nr:hypothetical protein Iba_chr04fCG13980 [Ipomoea batatas]
MNQLTRSALIGKKRKHPSPKKVWRIVSVRDETAYKISCHTLQIVYVRNHPVVWKFVCELPGRNHAVLLGLGLLPIGFGIAVTGSAR